MHGSFWGRSLDVLGTLLNITANFGMEAEIEATQPWRAALLRLRPVEKIKYRVSRTS